MYIADLVNTKHCALQMNTKNKKGENLKNKKLPCVVIIGSGEIKENYDQIMVAFEAQDLEKPSWSVYIITSKINI